MAERSRMLRFSVFRDGQLVASPSLGWPIIKIGRRPSCQLVLDDPAVDRMHAVIEVAGEEVFLIDLGSDAGTVVNGSRVNKTSLREGDRVDVGPFRIVFHGDSLADARPSAAIPAAPGDPSAPPAFELAPPRAGARQATRVDRLCSRCLGPLVEAPLGVAGHAYRELAIRALRCGDCAVTFVDVSTLERRLRRQVRLTGTAAERSRKSAKGRCPLCGESLDRVTLEWGGNWVTVEECPVCGLLGLEEGELAILERLAAIAG